MARIGVALGLILAAAALAGTQPPAPATPATFLLVDGLLPYLGDPGVQKELKLSEEQAKKLLAYRQKVWDADYATAPKDRDSATEGKATAAEFEATLSAAQLARANQLAAQFAWDQAGFGPGGRPGSAPLPDLRTVPASAVSWYPALADALALDETQKKLAATPTGGFGGPTSVYLTPAQAAAARAFLGPEYKGSRELQTDPRSGSIGGFSPFGTGTLTSATQYLRAADVQKELKLTDEQVKAAGELWRAAPPPRPQGWDFDATSPAERAKASAASDAGVRAMLDKLLTPDQRRRLEQIVRQGSGARGATRVRAAFTGGGEVADALAITAGQRKAFDPAHAACSEAVSQAVLSGQPFEKVKAAVDAAEQALDKAALAALTAEQRAKYQELIGEPFAGSVSGGGFGDRPGGLSPATRRKLAFDRYTGVTTLTQYKAVQDELKLTAEQLKKLNAAGTELRTKYSPSLLNFAAEDEKKADEQYAERSAYIEKVLGEVLSKEQFTRFRQLELQRWEAPGTRAPALNPAAGYPGVPAALELTAEQRQKLIGGGPQADVLTDDQKKTLKGLLGEPVDVAKMFTPSFGGGKGGPANPLPALAPTYQTLLNVRVWDGLKLTPEQVGKLVPAANAYQLVNVRRNTFGWGGFPGGPGGGPGGPAPLTPAEVEAANKAFTAAADAVLSDGQKARLRQLAVQQFLRNGLDTALLTNASPAGLGKALGVTEAQRAAIIARGDEFSRLAFLLNDTSLTWEQERNVRARLGERADAAARKELTAEQKAKLEELTGEPFDGLPRQPYYGSRFGGFGNGLPPGP